LVLGKEKGKGKEKKSGLIGLLQSKKKSKKKKEKEAV
jgi:hypothetical protein